MSHLYTQLSPHGRLGVLSKTEVAQLLDTSHGGLFELLRRCSLAVLNCGSVSDDFEAAHRANRDFDIRVIPQQRGIKLELKNPPQSAFVDNTMIRGIRDHLFSVLRDIIYTRNEILESGKFDLSKSTDITDAVFHILRNADLMIPEKDPNIVTCWGGHSIHRIEYDYSKEVGYELGLRKMDICTGCGPGAMKGPMKGATIGHSKQRHPNGRYIGITEPGIIAAESPNPIVNELAIMPDIEKRLEAFVRLGHGIIVFPGGVGTAEEILHLLGILLHPKNKDMPFPLIFTGPQESADYFHQIDAFIGETLGEEAQSRYQIIINDPVKVAQEILAGMKTVKSFRYEQNDAYYYNWLIHIEEAFQQPFIPNHENMRSLKLISDQPKNELAAHLRRAFSGIVAGNVKEDGIKAIAEHGVFELHGEAHIIKPLESLLNSFVAQGRMKLPGGEAYQPCYRVIGDN